MVEAAVRVRVGGGVRRCVRVRVRVRIRVRVGVTARVSGLRVCARWWRRPPPDPPSAAAPGRPPS